MKTKRQNKRGFTLIELMVVIVIIALLSAMVFRMMQASADLEKESETRARMEKIALALEKFKSIYGKYPSVPLYDGEQPMHFDCPVIIDGYGCTFDNGVAKRITEADHRKNVPWDYDRVHPQNPEWDNRLFTFGLLSFFLPRYQLSYPGGSAWFSLNDDESQNETIEQPEKQFNQWYKWNKKRPGSPIGDSLRDINAARQILPYLGATIDEHGQYKPLDGCIIKFFGNWNERKDRNVKTDEGEWVVSTARYTIPDAWGSGHWSVEGHDIHYKSRPPYETYELRSVGADGVLGTDDDIVIGEN